MSSPFILGLTRLSSWPGFKSKSPNTCLHVPPEGPVITSIISCAHTHRRGPFMRKSLVSIIPHALTRALPVLWCHDVVTLHTRFNPFIQLTRFEPDRPDSNCLKKKKKKKKREREKKKLWPIGPLTLTKKVKIFKRGLSHSVFRVHSNSRIRFFVQDLEIMQTVQIPESWLLHKFR